MPRNLTESNERGNVLFIILMVIVLSGLLAVAMQSGSGTGNENIDRERLSLAVSEVRQYAAELEAGVRYVLQNGASESGIRFAHPDAHSDYGDINDNPEFQVFAREGGGAGYRTPPEDINNGESWEFYGQTSLPQVGSSRPELIAVLPNVTQGFCELMNTQNGYDEDTQPVDSGTCLKGADNTRFDDGAQFASSPNTVDTGSFTVKPSLQGCVQCDGGDYHFFQVLMSR